MIHMRPVTQAKLHSIKQELWQADVKATTLGNNWTSYNSGRNSRFVGNLRSKAKKDDQQEGRHAKVWQKARRKSSKVWPTGRCRGKLKGSKAIS